MLSVAELIAIMMCVVILNVIMSVVMLSVAFYYYDACLKANCHYDESRYADLIPS